MDGEGAMRERDRMRKLGEGVLGALVEEELPARQLAGDWMTQARSLSVAGAVRARITRGLSVSR